MLSAWDRDEDDLQQAQEEVFGEYFRYEPRLQRPNKPTVPDPARQPLDCLAGVFTRPFVSDNFNPSALSTKGLKFTDMAQRKPAVEFRASLIPFEIKQGDQIVRLANGVRYEITVPEANGFGVITVRLIELGRSEHAP